MNIQDSSSLSMQVQTLSGDIVTINRDSNVTSTNNLSVTFNKTISTENEYIVEDENLQITITLSNQSDIAITDLSLKSVLSSDLNFVTGSVIIDDVPSTTGDIIAGVSLSNLQPTASHTVKFDVTTSSQLTGNLATAIGTVNYTIIDPIEGSKALEENTEEAEIEVVIADISIVNSVNKAYTIKGDSLHYVTLITNGTTSAKTNLVFSNAIPTGTTFIDGSVKVNDVNQPAYNPSTGFSLENLATEATAKVEFDVSVN